MSSQTYRERQENELQVMQSIYGNDLTDLRLKDSQTRKVERPIQVCLTLKPKSDGGNPDFQCHVQIDLIFICPSNYPDWVPEIRIENCRGLSNQQISSLKLDLEANAKKRVGDEMLLDLSLLAQNFLYENNNPPSKSFYDEMLSNHKREEEKVAIELEKQMSLMKRKEEKKMLQIEDIKQKRTEALRKEEAKQASEKLDLPSPLVSAKAAKNVQHTTSLGVTEGDRRTQQSPSLSMRLDYNDLRNQRTVATAFCSNTQGTQQPCQLHGDGIVVLAFNTKTERIIHRGTCLRHGLHGRTVFVGIDTKTGDLVAICEWVLKWRHIAKKSNIGTATTKDLETYRKLLQSIEHEMFSLLKLRHPNLLHYLAFKFIEDTGKISVYVLMEYFMGHSLDVYLQHRTISLHALRSYTHGLLDALQYLHSKDVVHKNLKASSVVIDADDNVRLSDYSINKRLCDLYSTFQEQENGVTCTSNRITGTGRHGKKGDIFELGLLVLSISLGRQADELLPIVPTTLPAALQDFISMCLMRDDKQRWSCVQLLEHQFIKDPIPQNVMQLLEEIKDKPPKQQEVNESDEDTGDLHPLLTALEASGRSRLTNEFEILKSLGTGGFGDVIKVKNKLDGRQYAIKRIPLNPKSQNFNRKITREVKLLSRLNHENVVRYYNSWIETSDEPASSDSSSMNDTPKNSVSERKVGPSTSFQKNSLNINDDIEKLAPPANDNPDDFDMSYDWSNPLGMRSHEDVSSGVESDSKSEDEEDVFDLLLPDLRVNSSIIFEEEFENANSCSIDQEENKDDNQVQSKSFVPKLYLYIQMEYCEKSTLRNCIDAGLYMDTVRLWRFLREIVEGLVHIHEQGMIHRDLKPVNIFLDSKDHVKIGDFGLATSNAMSKNTLKDAALPHSGNIDTQESFSHSVSIGDGTMTGQVGTALYVSPEMMVHENKVSYSQKVDIYSLGIIFFEMCYKPLQTGMERVKIIGELRKKEIVFPEDFDPIDMENQYNIIRWLLNHDPNKRPTSKELLHSSYIPPPLMEEAELDEVLRSAISDPQSKSYHHMISALFSQNVSIADDHLYDSVLYEDSFSLKSVLTSQYINHILERVFERHGAVKIKTPLLLPRQTIYDPVEQYTCLLDHSGSLIGLPFDLRVPFARFISKTNIISIKRYCIERVYRKKKVGGFHPRELTECSFDIVTSNCISLISDAEVIVVVQDVINEFPALQKRNYHIRMNHTSLLKAVLLHAKVEENKHAAVLSALAERDKISQQKSLTTIGISEQSSCLLLNLIAFEGQYSKVVSHLSSVTKGKGQSASLAKQALHELEVVITNAQILGLKLPVTVSVGWIHNTQMYKGVIFQVVFDMIKQKKTLTEVLAAGGRFDNLIKEFESRLSMQASPPKKQYGVGVSISFEKIMAAVLEQEEFRPPSAYDVLVCSIGHKPLLKERMGIVRELWNAGVKAEILHETLEGQEDQLFRTHGFSQLVILKDTDTTIKVRSIEKEKITEKSVRSISSLLEFLQQKLHPSDVEAKTPFQAISGKQAAPSGKQVTTTQSHIDNSSQVTSHGSNISVNFNFILQDGKLAFNTRKKHEAQIVSKVTSFFPWLVAKCIEVLALELPLEALRVMAAFLEIESTENAFDSSISTVIEKLPRYKKYLGKVMDEIHRLIFEEKCHSIVLYSIKDEKVKLLLTAS